MAYGYDQNQWTSSITDVDSKTYARDNDGNITGITDSATPATNQGYGYDALNRVSSSVVGILPSSVTYGYTYNANANRTNLTQSQAQPTAFTIDPNSNRLTQTQVLGGAGRTIVTDSAGNVTSDGVNGFTYDDQGRMATSTNSAGLVTTYAYNALGQRVSKANSNGTTYVVYDESGLLLGTYDTGGAAIDEILYLENRPVADVQGSTAYRVLTDLQTPRKLIDASNASVWSWDGKEAFGSTGPTGSVTFNLRFPGQYADTETGLFNNGFRDYAPAWGRYVESDPTGLSGGLNTYGYVAAEAISSFDENGLSKRNLFDKKNDTLNWQAFNSVPDSSEIYIIGAHGGYEDQIIYSGYPHASVPGDQDGSLNVSELADAIKADHERYHQGIRVAIISTLFVTVIVVVIVLLVKFCMPSDGAVVNSESDIQYGRSTIWTFHRKGRCHQRSDRLRAVFNVMEDL